MIYSTLSLSLACETGALISTPAVDIDEEEGGQEEGEGEEEEERRKKGKKEKDGRSTSFRMVWEGLLFFFLSFSSIEIMVTTVERREWECGIVWNID